MCAGFLFSFDLACFDAEFDIFDISFDMASNALPNLLEERLPLIGIVLLRLTVALLSLSALVASPLLEPIPVAVSALLILSITALSSFTMPSGLSASVPGFVFGVPFCVVFGVPFCDLRLPLPLREKDRKRDLNGMAVLYSKSLNVHGL